MMEGHTRSTSDCVHAYIKSSLGPLGTKSRSPKQTGPPWLKLFRPSFIFCFSPGRFLLLFHALAFSSGPFHDQLSFFFNQRPNHTAPSSLLDRLTLSWSASAHPSLGLQKLGSGAVSSETQALQAGLNHQIFTVQVHDRRVPIPSLFILGGSNLRFFVRRQSSSPHPFFQGPHLLFFHYLVFPSRQHHSFSSSNFLKSWQLVGRQTQSFSHMIQCNQTRGSQPASFVILHNVSSTATSL